MFAGTLCATLDIMSNFNVDSHITSQNRIPLQTETSKCDFYLRKVSVN